MLAIYGYRHTHNTLHLLRLHGNNYCTNADTLNVPRPSCLNFVAGQNSFQSEEKFHNIRKKYATYSSDGSLDKAVSRLD
jgi:hypothetical protein